MNLDKILTRKFSFKKLGWIYKYVQRNAAHKGRIMKLFPARCYDQGIKIAVQIVCSIRIGAVKDNRKRIVFFLNVFENFFHSNRPLNLQLVELAFGITHTRLDSKQFARPQVWRTGSVCGGLHRSGKKPLEG